VDSGGQQKHATHPTENVKRFMRTYLYRRNPLIFGSAYSNSGNPLLSGVNGKYLWLNN